MRRLSFIQWLAAVFAVQALCAMSADNAKIRVVIWDEQQPAQTKVYPQFLGNEIANYLKTLPDLEVTSVKLNDPEQGLAKETLDNCDVLIWWGHIRNREVPIAKGKEIAERIKAGKLSLIALHSAHWASPFVAAMWERAADDAMAKLSEAERKTVKLKLLEPKLGVGVKRTDPLTPFSEMKDEADGSKTLEVHLPICVFPAWRADGMPSHVKTLLPDHPIAKGIPATFDVPQTEMYDEPFHVPAPDQVIFEEHWDKGEHFRSGDLWNVGKGKVFYFRPGHETFGVYKEAIPLKIVANAVYFLGGR